MQLQPEKVKDFFDRLASTWDSTREPNYPVIERILDAAGITAGVTVLDAACGTGVLFPSCLRRGVRHLTGVDLSPEMIRIAGKNSLTHASLSSPATRRPCPFPGMTASSSSMPSPTSPIPRG